MKKGKIVLSAAAFLVTASAALAFKSHNFRTNKVRIITANNGCAVCKDVWTDLTGTPNGASGCVTSVGNTFTSARSGKTFFTQVSNGAYIHPVTKVTVTQ